MEMVSPIYAALGVIEFDVLTDLAGWLDGRSEPAAGPEKPSGGQAVPAPRPSGREG